MKWMGVIVAWWFAWLMPSSLHAGLGPENVFLVVNGGSADSLTIANHYLQLRSIPTRNVMVLDDVPGGPTVSLENFREKILRPILAEIDRRGLSPHIRVVTYSAGFPYGVRIKEHTEKLTEPNAKKYQTPVASLNSLTFFYRFVLADSPEYLGWGGNLYARGGFERNFSRPFQGALGEQFDAAQDAVDLDQFDEAAKQWEALAERFPTMAPLHILAAESFIQADNRNEAIRHLGLAVKKGWRNRRYLQKESPLATLLETVTPSGSGPLSKLIAGLDDLPFTQQSPIGFAADVGWTGNGLPAPIKDGGMSYMLSSVLAVVRPNGSSIDQAVAYLTRSKLADRTFPDGTVGLSRTGDVRTKTRFPMFTDALGWLLARERDVKIFPSKLPTGQGRYVGLVLGTAKFDVLGRRWSIVPGGIADNLTSTGAVFTSTSQTKLTELLHAGAAMSSGAVTEPYSIPMKFPSPMLHPYYYEGVTAIEAFYLTTPSPYQLLIVGDPLTQPFARSPADSMEIKLDPQTTADNKRVIEVNRTVTNTGGVDADRHTEAAMMELYVQDRLVQRLRPINNIKLQVPATTYGPVSCRVVLVGDHPIRPRTGVRAEFFLGPPEKLPSIRPLPKVDTDKLSLELGCVGAESIDLLHLGRTVATVSGNTGTVDLDLSKVGEGPLRLQAIGRKGDQSLSGKIEVLQRDAP